MPTFGGGRCELRIVALVGNQFNSRLPNDFTLESLCV